LIHFYKRDKISDLDVWSLDDIIVETVDIKPLLLIKSYSYHKLPSEREELQELILVVATLSRRIRRLSRCPGGGQEIRRLCPGGDRKIRRLCSCLFRTRVVAVLTPS